MRCLRATHRDVRSLLKRAKELELSEDAVLRLRWFLFALEHDGNVSLACRHFGIARSTFVRWAKRFTPRDLQSLEEETRAPHAVRQPETSPHIVALIRRIRETHPLLGKQGVARLLREQGVELSASTVGRVIEREGFFFADTPSHHRKRREHRAPDASHGESPSLFLRLDAGLSA